LISKLLSCVGDQVRTSILNVVEFRLISLRFYTQVRFFKWKLKAGRF